MGKILNILEATIGLIGASYFFLYYTGRLNYTGEKEFRRQERARKYGWLFVFVIILLLSCSLGLIVNTFSGS
jgi:hypothetical protein